MTREEWTNVVLWIGVAIIFFAAIVYLEAINT